ncbi:MAG: Ig-like domain-containing protein [candidate division Zixibacteria bacterium]|nr:Ig-like domain-containing protein [candidate division Zixibacteria bacterium]MDH3936060.1 Ig-like domain-containing protein [candidate division Zixibacteria bacterium]MDH4033552.1 Ig-like domain-containing protein [candidate division Zixibacteria bacterium]
MKKATLFILTVLLLFSCMMCAQSDTDPPRVVSTFPQNGSMEVDPTLTEIAVVFNEEMMDQNWSWVYEDKNSFPTMTGQPYYNEDLTRNILPVSLESGREYVVWINSSNFKNFKDKNGNPAAPFKMTFRTI